MFCKNCGNEIIGEGKFCQKCGTPTANKSNNSKNGIVMVLGGLLAVFILVDIWAVVAIKSGMLSEFADTRKVEKVSELEKDDVEDGEGVSAEESTGDENRFSIMKTQQENTRGEDGENLRLSYDKDLIDKLTRVVQSACTDENYYCGVEEGDAVTISRNGGIVTTGAYLQAAMDEFYGTIGGVDRNEKFKSKAFANEIVTITIVTQANPITGASIYSAKVTDSKGLYDPTNYK